MFKKKAIKHIEAPPAAETMAIPSYFGGFGPPARFRQRKKNEDAVTYDYRLARHNLPHPNNIKESVIHLLMFGAGSGSVAAHAGYMSCGIWASLAVNMLISMTVSYCVCSLVWSAQRLYGRIQHPQLSYPDTAEAAMLLSKWRWTKRFARPFRYIVEVTLSLHCYASCVVLLIMISRNLKELVEGDENLSDDGNPPLRVYILSMMLPCMVVCMVSNLKYLAPFALIAVIYCVAVMVMTVWYACKNDKLMPWDRPSYKNMMGFVRLIGMCIFVTETASVALPIENNMNTPKKFHYVMVSAMPIVTLLMMTIGFCGYWNYGEIAFSPITVHFPFDPFSIQLKVFLCILLYVMIAIYSYCAFDVEWFYFKRLHKPANYWFWERVYRSLHVVVIDLIAYAAPTVSGTMSIIGCMFTNPIVFFYPQLIEMLVCWDYPGLGRHNWRLVKCIFIMFISLVIMLGGTGLNVYRMIYDMYIKPRGRVVSNATTESNFFDITGRLRSFNGDY
nr:proton-coupled amino acid transporter-like protein pathetic [Helicoverpa armigera]